MASKGPEASKRIVAVSSYIDSRKIGTTKPTYVEGEPDPIVDGDDNFMSAAPSAPPVSIDDDQRDAEVVTSSVGQKQIPDSDRSHTQAPECESSSGKSSHPDNRSPTKDGTSNRKNLVLWGIVAVSIAAALASIYLGMLEPERYYKTTVTKLDWKTAVYVSRLKEVVREDWVVPVGVHVLSSELRQKPSLCRKEKEEYVVEEPSNEFVDVPYQVEIPGENKYARTDRVHYDDGTFEEIDVYEQEPSRTETHIRTDAKEVKKKVTHSREVEVCPPESYVPWYTYSYQKWVKDKKPVRECSGKRNPISCDVEAFLNDSVKLEQVKTSCDVDFVVEDLVFGLLKGSLQPGHVIHYKKKNCPMRLLDTNLLDRKVVVARGEKITDFQDSYERR